MGTRRFRADYLKGEGTGIGIVEYGGKHKKYNWELDVRAIHSFYIKEKLSNRDAQVAIFQFISNQLAEDEFAILQMNKFSRQQNRHLPYKNKLSVHHIEHFRGRIMHARLLAEDALRRKTDISESFDEPMQFSIIQAEKERGHNDCKKEKPKA